MKGFQEIDCALDETYEYVFTPVPTEKRKPTHQLILILVGFALSSSGLATGGAVGTAFSFPKAAGICLLGNLVLFSVALFWGIQGYQSGDTSIFRVKKELGELIGTVFSIIVFTATIIWIGMNGELLARFMVGAFPGWPLPVAVTALLIVTLGIYCSRNGWKSLVLLSRTLVPFLILMILTTVLHISSLHSGFSFLASYEPLEELSFFTALAMVIGNFAMSATMMADICRFAKSRKTVVLCVLAYTATLILNDFTGILIVQATDAHNVNYGLFLLGSVIQSFVWFTLCGFTTQSVNLYMGSLAIQHLLRKTSMGGNISYKTSAYFVGGIAAIVAVVRFRRGFETFTQFLMFVVLSLTAVVFGKVLVRWYRKTKI